MSIQKRHRGGERNYYSKNVIGFAPLNEVSELLIKTFMTALHSKLDKDITLEFHNSTTIATTHSNGESVAYHVDFYPLDVNLKLEEAGAIFLAKYYDNQEYLPPVVLEIIKEQVENILTEVKRVRHYHPESSLSIIFAPADTIDSVGTIAKPMYGFLIHDGKTVRFESECSFLVIPDNEPSKAYGEEV